LALSGASVWIFLILLGERQVRRTLRDYIRHYNEGRPHSSLGPGIPDDPDASLQFRTLAAQVDESLARERLLAALSGFSGGLALLLAIVGLYGVVSYNRPGGGMKLESWRWARSSQV
jgi:hypothetical protein